jgi:beta-aspartyl-dipeptidase (metallo-type)
MLTLIQNAEIYAPHSIGRSNLLLANGGILKIGEVTEHDVRPLGLDLELICADGCVVIPGFFDPHQHILGGSGEEGFATQTPEISAGEIVSSGITSVVGCLGVDTTMKTLPGLLAKIKGLKEEGLNAYMWSGGYNVPPTTITN